MALPSVFSLPTLHAKQGFSTQLVYAKALANVFPIRHPSVLHPKALGVPSAPSLSDIHVVPQDHNHVGERRVPVRAFPLYSPCSCLPLNASTQDRASSARSLSFLLHLAQPSNSIVFTRPTSPSRVLKHSASQAYSLCPTVRAFLLYPYLLACR
jgi:hypothetical protein